MSDVRKIYLYNAGHDCVLMVSLGPLAARYWGFVLSTEWVVGIMIGAVLALGQLPYVIGQDLFHESVVERLEGVERTEMETDLRKHAPLFPTLDFVRALAGTGTAGGLVVILLDGSLKKLFHVQG